MHSFLRETVNFRPAKFTQNYLSDEITDQFKQTMLAFIRISGMLCFHVKILLYYKAHKSAIFIPTHFIG